MKLLNFSSFQKKLQKVILIEVKKEKKALKI